MSHRNHDLLIVADATASMGSFLSSLEKSIPEILALTRLSGLFSRVGVLAYRDYCDKSLIEWSGWDNDPKDLLEFVAKLTPDGGGDYPEAAKTGLIHALNHVDSTDQDKETIVLLYTDAPPHHQATGGGMWRTEKEAFKPGETDWVTISFTAKARRMRVFSFVATAMPADSRRFYAFLSEVTSGVCVTTSAESEAISRLTIDVLLHWMGAVESGAEPFTHQSKMIKFLVSPLTVQPQPTDENSGDGGYLLGNSGSSRAKLSASALQLAQDVPRANLDVKIVSLAKRFADPEETAYRALVYTTLTEIISQNAFSLTYNAVFGQLWRAVCREQTEEKERVVQLFSKSVGAIKSEDKRKGMSAWLETSYDSSAEIEGIIKKAGEGGQWMYLDLDFRVDMTRIELLEASRSYHRGVLKRLATIFTHAKIVEPDTVLTEHQRAIPLNLPPRQVFRLLPHLIVPGTLYSVSASNMMAILALTVGVPFLAEAATTVAGYTKDTWLDIEHPETLSWECAAFLLNAPDPDICLTARERKIYSGMRRYRMLELNLDATLNAIIPWTPEKARGVGDVRVACALCRVKRSVTIMSDDMRGVCGFCVDSTAGDKSSKPPPHEEMDSCWVECSVRTCHAQYVVENPSALNVRPKCWYCRQNKPCPYVTCSTCTNRIIMPKKYAPSHKDVKHYKCPACTAAKRSVQETVEITPRALVDENGVSWLGIASIDGATFKGQSAFKLFNAHGSAPFKPAPIAAPVALRLRDKTIVNAAAVIQQLDARVGRGEVARRTCALCFEDFAPDKVGPACGRSGCAQRVCVGCLNEWYGKNKPGALLNVMELTCPFCRRVPVAKIVLRTNPEVGGLKGIKNALEDRAWFYAWCGQCSFARQCIERRCTTDGRLPEVKDFVCEGCEEENEREVARLEEEQRRVAEEIERMGQDEQRAAAAARHLAQVQAAQNRARRLQVVQECPNEKCGVMVHKTWGCDHITCQCRAHWCWVCRWMGPEGEIYQHLNKEHGGFYADFDDEDWASDEDEDED